MEGRMDEDQGGVVASETKGVGHDGPYRLMGKEFFNGAERELPDFFPEIQVWPDQLMAKAKDGEDRFGGTCCAGSMTGKGFCGADRWDMVTKE